MWSRDDVQVEIVDTPPITREHLPPGLFGTIRNADVVCIVVEAGESILEETEEALEILHDRGISLGTGPMTPESRRNGEHAGVIVANKCDLAGHASVDLLRELHPDFKVLGVSARTGEGFEELFRTLWEALGVIRVYSKEPGKPPDLHKPFVVPAGATVADLAGQIHRDLPQQMKFARLWGHSRFEGQQVHKTEPLRDRDIVEIHE
jgi:ribosome-interacting GTPase 1